MNRRTTRHLPAAALGLLALAAASLPVVASAAPQAPATPGRYIVRTATAQGVPRVSGDVRSGGGHVTTVYSRVLTGFAATMTPLEARRLASDPAVTSVTADAVFHTTTVQSNAGWDLDRLDQRTTTGDHAYGYATTGSGVTAFVIDTGVRRTHTQFGGRVRGGYDFVDADSNPSDCFGHGTHVAGSVGASTYGVAKAVTVVPLRVLDCDGAGWASDIIDSLDWVIAHKPTGPAVVNMSLGGGAYDLLDRAVERTVAAGIPVVVAAGNSGADACTASPARAPHAITVAATDRTDTRPAWSNVGRCVDLFAPGVDVRSASNASDTATELESGTSMAAPHVTGMVARYLQGHTSATPAQVVAALTAVATPGVVKDAQGSPNRLLFAARTATAPTAPTAVSATTSGTSATLHWNLPANDGGKAVTGFKVTRNGKDAAGHGPVSVIVSVATRSRTFTGLRAGSWYSLSVSAVNVVGTSASASAVANQAW